IHFLRHVYPALQLEVPDAQLWILGGTDAHVIAARDSCFELPGVKVFDFIEDVQPYLGGCSISINPDKEVRGSSLKVIESLAAGRICVSTLDGARGLVTANLTSLRIVEEDQFAGEIIRLLKDAEYRHRLEVPTEVLNRFSWQRASEDQLR